MASIDRLCLKLSSLQPLPGLHINEENEYLSKNFQPQHLHLKTKINTLSHFMNTDQGLLPSAWAGINYDEEGELGRLWLTPLLHLLAHPNSLTVSLFSIIFNGS